MSLAPLARWLESDRPRSPAVRALASLWAAASASRLPRRISIPPGAHVVGIGGATLGGSGKTPFAIALAKALAERGETVALIGHAYRARPGSTRIVVPTDQVREVGDDALFAARSLASHGVDVIISTARQTAIDHAASRASWLIVDGLLQAEPTRLARSVLVVDGRRPWGNGSCPPAGDLRAPREVLEAAADAIIPVVDPMVDAGASSSEVQVAPKEHALSSVAASEVPGVSEVPSEMHALAFGARAHLEGAIGPDGATTRLADLRGATLGFISSIARPDRVLSSLAGRGLSPAISVELGDHARPKTRALERAASRKHRVNAWLATSKCALNLPQRVAGAPVFALDFRLELPKELVEWVLRAAPASKVLCPSSPGQNPW